LEKILKINKWGLRILEMALHDYKMMERKQVVIKHRAKIHTEALYFALNIGHE